MAPSTKQPTSIDYFFARNQMPILLGTFATQVGHYQYIRRTTPAVESYSNSIKAAPIPRALRAGLGWAAVFVGLLTQITLAKKSVRDYSDPIIAQSLQKKVWKRPSPEGL
jgi:uncharacterized integral membrane protein